MIERIGLKTGSAELFAATGFVIMWSSGFIGARLGTHQAGTLNVLMWRFLIAGGLLAAWWLWQRRSRLRFQEVVTHAVIGLLAQGVYLFGVFSSVGHGVSAGTSALITALQPIAAALLAGPVLKQSTTGRQWFGLLLGMLGVALVVSGDMHGVGTTPIWAYGLSLMAMAGLVAATLIERKLGPQLALADALPIQCIATGTAFCLLAVLTGQATPPHSTDFWLAIAWVVGLSTFGGYGFYWFNLRLGNVTRVSSLIYLTPPVTMLWAYGMFGDTIGVNGLLGLFICLIAVMLVRYRGAILPNATLDVIPSIQAYIQARRTRQGIRKLLAFDDHLLADLGYCRPDLIRALRTPVTGKFVEELQNSQNNNAYLSR